MDLEKNWNEFEALDIELVSIMVDPMAQLASSVKQYGIKTIVATDTDKSVSTTYDALGASMHPGVKPGHTFVLVNKAGEIIFRRDWGYDDAGGMMYTDVDELYGLLSDQIKKDVAG